MQYWITFSCMLVVFVSAQPSDNEDTCAQIDCVGEEYICEEGQCTCAEGYIYNYFHNRCIPCPGLGESCYGQCCRRRPAGRGNGTLYCWQGICQPCYDRLGNDICREPLDQYLLVSTTQIVMGAALVLGVIVTFILLYKLCAVTSLRPLGSRSTGDSRLSIGSLQLYVDERLRDPPPRYSRASAISPITAYSNPGFVHDPLSIPPPLYSEIKNEDNQIPTLHI